MKKRKIIKKVKAILKDNKITCKIYVQLRELKNLVINRADYITWRLFKKKAFFEYLTDKYEVKGLEPFLTKDWHLGHKYFTAKYQEKKVFIKTGGGLKLSKREIGAIQRIRQSNAACSFLPTVMFSSISGMYDFVALEYLNGNTLDEVMNSKELNSKQIDSLLNQLSDITNSLHNARVIHRDIRPKNLMVTTLKEDEVILKLIDYSLAALSPDDEFEELASKRAFKATSNMNPDFSPRNLLWDDAYSITQIIKLLFPPGCRESISYKNIASRIGQLTYKLKISNMDSLN